MHHTSSPLKAFKRAPSLELSKWYMGNLTTNLAETNDTNGAFCLVGATLVPGNEPPPHVHSREDELFYVLEGAFDEAFRGTSAPAQRLDLPTGALTYATADVKQTAQRLSAYGVRLLAPDE